MVINSWDTLQEHVQRVHTLEQLTKVVTMPDVIRQAAEYTTTVAKEYVGHNNRTCAVAI